MTASAPASAVRSRVRSSLRLLLVAVVALVLSGCTMRTMVGVHVNPDGSGTLEMTMAFDEEFRELLAQDSPAEIDWTDPAAWEDSDGPGASLAEDLPDGASVVPYTEDGFEGIVVSVPFDSLDELNEQVDEFSSTDGEAEFPIRVTSPSEGRFELSTDGEIFGSAADEFSGDDAEEMFPPEALAGLFDVQIRASLPGELVSHNADEVTDSGELVWRVNPLEDSDREPPAAVSQVESSSVVLWVVGVILMALALGGAFAFTQSRSSSDEVLVDDPADGSDSAGLPVDESLSEGVTGEDYLAEASADDEHSPGEKLPPPPTEPPSQG